MPGFTTENEKVRSGEWEVGSKIKLRTHDSALNTDAE